MATVAIDARFYGPEHTGIGRYTQNVLTHLPKHLKKHHLLILLRPKYYHTLSLPANARPILCDLPHYSLAEQLLLPPFLKHHKIDLLYTFHLNTPVLSSIPTVLTLHDLIKNYFRDRDTTTRALWFYHLKRAGYHYVVKRALIQAKAIIVPTNTVKNQILANYPPVPPERIHPIPEAPDSIFLQKSLANLKLENSRFENFPSKYLLFVGNAYPHKNLHTLLKAFRLLKDPTLHFVIVSKLTPFLSRTLAPYEPRNIHILSELSDTDLIAVYRRALTLITPSLMEGYGLVGLEAQMVGTPVIASDISVYREVYGDSVTYFDPHSVASLLSALKTVLSAPRPKPRLFKRSWDEVAQSIAEVINESCARL